MRKIYSLNFKSKSFFLKACFAVSLFATLSLGVCAQNFTTITWSTAKGQPKGTHEVHGEVVNGKLYVFGGYDVDKRPNWTPTKRSYVYDPVTNIWSSIADLPHLPNGTGFGGITHEGLTNDGTNIYFAGGYPSNSTGTGQVFGTKQVWRYNVSSNNYTRLPDLPEALAAGQLRYLNGRIHYIGGANFSRKDVSVHYALDLNTPGANWVSLAPLLNPVNHPGSAVYGGKIYFVGGAHEQNHNTVTQKTLEAYDPVTNKWTLLADLPVARDHISSSVVVMGDRIIVLGGETSHNSLSSLVSAYSPATNTWQALTPLPVAKSAGVAAVLNGSIYYTGGNFSNVNRKGVPATTNQTSQTTLSAVADAFVRNGSFSGTNYGSDTALIVKGSTSSGYTRYSYLKFSLNNITNVASAKLRLYGRNTENTSAISVSCFGVSNDGWTENAINFSTAPPASTSILSSVRVNDQAAYYELDVSSFVKSQFSGDKVVTFLVRDTGTQNKNIVFRSREHTSNQPRLVIASVVSRSLSATDLSFEESDINEAFSSKSPVVFPNPVHKVLNIKFPKEYKGKLDLQLIDQTGKTYQLGTKLIPEGSSVLSVNISNLSLSPGVYFLRTTSGVESKYMKLFVR